MRQSMIGNNSPLDRLRQRQRVAVRNGAEGKRQGARLSAGDERLLRRILSEEMDYIDSEAFYQPDAEKRIFQEAPEIEKPDVAWYRPLMDDLTPTKHQSTKKNPGTVLLSGAEE